MTDAASLASPRPASPLPAIAAVAICVFLTAWLFLAWQLHAGHDPALGAGGATPVVKQVTSGAAKHHSAPVLVTRASGGGH
jgi:hypothetical protein